MSTYEVDLSAISRGYDRTRCWVHARPGIIPGDGPTCVVTMQKLRLTGVDVFEEINEMRSDDGGKTWSKPVSHRQTLGRRARSDGFEEGICDFTPMWHAESGKLLGTGHTVRYRGDDLIPQPRPRATAYSVYDPAASAWAAWRMLEGPDDPMFYSEGAGCTQRVDLPGGDILLPTYCASKRTLEQGTDQYVTTVMRCGFDGATLRYIEHGTTLTFPRGRGFGEPSLARVAGRFFLTLRNDDAGYVATGSDGLHFGAPLRWSFDDGTDLGNYNTQQHWVTHRDELYLVYTRRGADNDHIPRHRAPLFIGQVDLDRLCIIRQTERILVPQRGARLGNFGVAQLHDDESWVVVAEWMQTKPPKRWDVAQCEKYGSDNSVFLAKVRWK